MKFIAGIMIGILLVMAAGVAAIVTGFFDTAATVPPSPLEEGLAEFALDRSIAKRVPDIPSRVSFSPQALHAGLSNYRGECLHCHGAPQVEASEFSKGLNPPAPDLAAGEVQARPDQELYWITSQGIRMTGMPAFSPTHSEEEIWQIVSFVRHLPDLTREERELLSSRALLER